MYKANHFDWSLSHSRIRIYQLQITIKNKYRNAIQNSNRL